MVGVTIENVTKRFGDVAAVEGVTLEIARGELFFLLGPSGCGKTTLLRMVAGFYTPDVGRIVFDDRDVTNVPPHKRNTGMVFQNYALWPHLTVEENVAYGLDVRDVSASERKDRVAKALETVRMQRYAGRSPNQLSGGQQQRVALARALVIEPDAVLLDEPLSNLDAKLRLEMREEIKRIHETIGITMIYVTHDQKEALSMADRLAVMKDGRVCQTGDPRAIYNHPRSAFVAGFIGETKHPAGDARQVRCGCGDGVGSSEGRGRAGGSPGRPRALLHPPRGVLGCCGWRRRERRRVVRNGRVGALPGRDGAVRGAVRGRHARQGS